MPAATRTHGCEFCGAEFRHRSVRANRFCTIECVFAARKLAAVEAAAARKLTASNNHRRKCAICASEFSPRQSNHRLCSEACRRRDACQWHRKFQERRKPLIPHTCRECRQSFVPRYGNKRRRFCSSQCADRFGNRIERVRHRSNKRSGERFSATGIYERDGWHCRLCGEIVDRSLPCLHPDAPTIDHIIPISRGGKHIRANVQLAHRKCNVRKGNGAFVPRAGVQHR